MSWHCEPCTGNEKLGSASVSTTAVDKCDNIPAKQLQTVVKIADGLANTVPTFVTVSK